MHTSILKLLLKSFYSSHNLFLRNKVCTSHFCSYLKIYYLPSAHFLTKIPTIADREKWEFEIVGVCPLAGIYIT